MYNVGQCAFGRSDAFKYLGSSITEDAGCEVDIRARVGMATAAFWQNKELMRRNTRFKTVLKLIKSNVCGVELWL